MSENNKLFPIPDPIIKGIMGICLEIPDFDFTQYYFPKKRSVVWVPGKGILIIRLIDQELIEEFTDFYETTEKEIDLSIQDEEILLTLKSLFRKREKLYKSLSSINRDEAMGLFGELLFLREQLINPIAHSDPLIAWRRPDRSTHDFDFEKKGYEIKAVGLTSKTVKISTENQLNSLNHERLFLVCYQVEIHKSTKVNSVEMIASEIVEILDSPMREAEFIEKIDRELADFKFEITPQYKIINEVGEDFPKITPEKLSENLSHVQYEISMSYIEKHGEKSKMAK